MTAKQKAAREKFKKVVAQAGKLRKKNPKLTQAQAVKQAFAANKKVGAVKKKGASKRITDIHKDSKSHNVNIRVVSGIDSIVSKTMKDISETKKIILEQSELLERLQQSYKRMKNKENKELLMMDIKKLKNNFIPHNKRYLKQLQISLKKSI
jgi:biotin-(acetyl-CoA carboxylase) ligase